MPKMGSSVAVVTSQLRATRPGTTHHDQGAWSSSGHDCHTRSGGAVDRSRGTVGSVALLILLATG